MELMGELSKIAERIPAIRSQLATEEATKNALIMPFIQALGYNVFNPLEVVPEFTADVGIKKHEKVDYVIMHEGAPVVLIECKDCASRLGAAHGSQLFRYFATTTARISILTNGIEYRFYSDIKAPNKMDETPFLVLDLLNLREEAVAELQHLTKCKLDINRLTQSAGTLMASLEIKRLLAAELTEPGDDFIRLFAGRVHDGPIRQGVLDKYRAIVKRAAADHVRELVEARLRAALKSADTAPDDGDEDGEPPASMIEAKGPETSVEELEGYFIVKAIVRDLVDTSRVHPRDVNSYFGVLLDNNNRKPICRLHLNGGVKYLGVFDGGGNEERRIQIGRVEEIFEHAEAVRGSLGRLL